MRSIFALALFACVAAATQEDDEAFTIWAAKNNKSFKSSSEWSSRKANWKASDNKIKDLNAKSRTARFDHNLTSDLTDEEFKSLTGAVAPDMAKARKLDDISDDRRHLQTDGIIDWTELGKVGPVKDQGPCGSCWAFATTTTIEAMVSIKTGEAPVRLSESEGVDCTLNTQANLDLFGTTYGNSGCNGGWMNKYYRFSRDQGSSSYASYPYVPYEQLCNHSNATELARASTWGQITTNISDVVVRLQQGPIPVAMAAYNDAFRYYRSGVITSAECSTTAIDHVIVVVGYDVETETTTTQGASTTTCRKARKAEKRSDTCPGEERFVGSQGGKCCLTTTTSTTTETVTRGVWKVQNSWSTGWGSEGMIYMAAEGGAGVCGMNQFIEWVDVQ